MNDLQERLMEFGASISAFCDQLTHPINPYGTRHIGRQLLRAGTSIGANYEEAQGAESKADFTHKIQVSLKESRECHYWIKLLMMRKISPQPTLQKLLDESGQICAILTKAVITAKSRPKR